MSRICLLILLFVLCPVGARAGKVVAIDQPGLVLHGGSPQAAARQAASADSFHLYGGPGTLEGKFETAGGVGDMQGWVGVDLSQQWNPWKTSDFNAANLGGHGPSNNAAWCGVTAETHPGWATAPGYGNNWDAILLYESPPVPDSSAGQDVSLDFVFNYDTEPGYDFFEVDYDSAGTWITVLAVSGTNADSSGNFASPGAEFANMPGVVPIHFDGLDYGGTNGDQVRIRLRFTSDGAWSDQDGLWPSSGGAQVDDLVVSSTAESVFTDFESGFGPWYQDIAPFTGDFFKTFQRVQDIDPCRENPTPVVGFADDGRPVGNGEAALFYYGTDTTGGTVAQYPESGYGLPGGYIIPEQGGLSSGTARLNNQGWSPPIAWDLPGSADDGPDFHGLRLEFDVQRDLSLSSGYFYVWHLRFKLQGGVGWEPWVDRNFIYYGNDGDWLRRADDVTDLVPAGAESVQIALGVYEFCSWHFGCRDANHTPMFDDVSLVKYRVEGPAIAARTQDLFQDAFPASGLLDASTQAARDQLDIRLDMAQDVSSGLGILPGDSLAVSVAAPVAGTELVPGSVVMHWVLDRNPLFDDVRALPAGATSHAWGQWTGTVSAEPVGGSSTAGYFVDLPDADFFHPGDVLRYYLQASDTLGGSASMPADTTGFASGEGYDRRFTVRGLPSIVDDGQGGTTQPPILLVNDFGHRGGEGMQQVALAELGLVEGVDFDSYTVRAPASGVSNGIGSTAGHGAALAQLAGYTCLLYTSGNLSSFTLSGGRDNGYSDKSDDIGLLTAWHGLPGPRAAAFFGDKLASSLDERSAGRAFLSDILGASSQGPDVGADLGGVASPDVEPEHAAFSAPFFLFGGCPTLLQFDSVGVAGGGLAGHRFLGADGLPYAGAAASVVHDRTDGLGDRKLDLFLPFGMTAAATAQAQGGASALTVLLSEFLELSGEHTITVTGTTPPALPLSGVRLVPSPFNPRTTLRWITGLRAHNRVVVYDARGRQVEVLVDETRASGPQEVQWEGRAASSGVYLFEVEVGGERAVRKGILLK